MRKGPSLALSDSLLNCVPDHTISGHGYGQSHLKSFKHFDTIFMKVDCVFYVLNKGYK